MIACRLSGGHGRRISMSLNEIGGRFEILSPMEVVEAARLRKNVKIFKKEDHYPDALFPFFRIHFSLHNDVVTCKKRRRQLVTRLANAVLFPLTVDGVQPRTSLAPALRTSRPRGLNFGVDV